MKIPLSRLARRRLLQGLSLGGAYFTTRGLLAEELFGTPALTEGPFYPDKLPLDKDDDLVKVSSSGETAAGEVTQLFGRVLDADGKPISGAMVEIWQCDAGGVYLHSADSGNKDVTYDKNFQGYGAFATNDKGEYRFRTIKPVPYRMRPAPHIHFKIKKGEKDLLTTQLFIRGHAGNRRDGIFNAIRDLVDRELLQADFAPLKGSKDDELAAQFDIVIGRTPDERNIKPGRSGE